MPNLIKPTSQTTKIVNKKVVTQDGEAKLEIALRLDININADGVAVSAHSIKAEGEDDDGINWAIPDFDGEEKIEFGKTIKE